MPVIIDGNTGVNLVQDGSITSSKIADGAVMPVDLANSGNELGMRNRIINGNFAIWQRGTSTNWFGTSGFASDRWVQGSVGNITNSQSTDAPAGFLYSMQMAAISAVGSDIRQKIESLNCQDLGGGTVTVSFWLRSTTAGVTIDVSLSTATGVDNFSNPTVFSTRTLTTSNTAWTFYSFTFSGLPASASNGLYLRLKESAGNCTWLITGVQLEKVSTATAFDYRPYGTELALCQRYYWKFTSNVDYRLGVVRSSGSTSQSPPMSFPVPMRVVPTATVITQPSTALYVRALDDATQSTYTTISVTPLTSTDAIYQVTQP